MEIIGKKNSGNPNAFRIVNAVSGKSMPSELAYVKQALNALAKSDGEIKINFTNEEKDSLKSLAKMSNVKIVCQRGTEVIETSLSELANVVLKHNVERAKELAVYNPVTRTRSSAFFTVSE
jgi:hypothetical protein